MIYKLRDLLGVEDMGGTMRLGAYPTELEEGSFAHQAYGTQSISERHRHRYEVNQEFTDRNVERGRPEVSPVMSPDGKFVEMVEYVRTIPWFVACQFHPEYKSRPLEPAPVVSGVRQAAAYKARIGPEPKSDSRQPDSAGCLRSRVRNPLTG